MAGFDFIQLRNLAYAGLSSPHFDIGPIQAKTAGEWNYVGTRNNAFSNRSQKGKLVVLPSPAWAGLPDSDPAKSPASPIPVSLYGATKSASGKAKLQEEWTNADMKATGAVIVPGSVTVDDIEAGDGTWYVLFPPSFCKRAETSERGR